MMEAGEKLNKLLQSDLSCYHKQVVKGNDEGKEDSINIVMPDKLKTVKTLAEQSNRFCENFKKQVETLKDSEGKKHLLGFGESYLTHTKSINDNVDRIETKIGDINRIIKDKKQIAKDTEEVSEDSPALCKAGTGSVKE